MEKSFTGEHTRSLIKPRPEDSHKGTFGTLAALVGSPDMPGAAYLACTAALRSGAGLVAHAGDRETQSYLKSCLYEAVYISPDRIPHLRGMTACLVGCGIGRGYDSVLGTLLPSTGVKTVIDADGINYLAANINVLKNTRLPGTEFILTPHPAEMARLMGRDIDFIQSDREGIASAFAAEYGCVLVLKGKGTVIALPDGSITVNTTGGSGLARGGSGDVLAGVIGSLCAQGYSAADAAVLAVYLHGLAADRLSARLGTHGMLPRDLPAEIGALLG